MNMCSLHCSARGATGSVHGHTRFSKSIQVGFQHTAAGGLDPQQCLHSLLPVHLGRNALLQPYMATVTIHAGTVYRMLPPAPSSWRGLPHGISGSMATLAAIEARC